MIFLSDLIPSGPLNGQGNGYWKVRMEDGTGKAFRPATGRPVDPVAITGH